MQIVSAREITQEWRNMQGERVVVTKAGRLLVLNERGESIGPGAVTPARCNNAAGQPGHRWRPVADTPSPTPRARAAHSSHNADANGVVELPFMAIVPYWKQPKK